MDLSEPRGEPRGPRIMVPVRFFYRAHHCWTLDFAAACRVCLDGSGLAGVQIEEPVRCLTANGALVNLADVVGELRQGARLLSLLLREGLRAGEISNRLHCFHGESVVQIGGAQGFCANAGAAVVLACVNAEAQLQHSALPELRAAGLLSEMG